MNALEQNTTVIVADINTLISECNEKMNLKFNNYAELQSENRSLTWGLGSAWTNAPCISLYSPAYTTNQLNAGAFIIRAISSDGTRKELVGKPDGTIQWNEKPILQTINGTYADSNGNINITFDSGISAGTEDLEAGVSELEHGKFYFVFEL